MLRNPDADPRLFWGISGFAVLAGAVWIVMTMNGEPGADYSYSSSESFGDDYGDDGRCEPDDQNNREGTGERRCEACTRDIDSGMYCEQCHPIASAIGLCPK